jgi:hypothetical protein
MKMGQSMSRADTRSCGICIRGVLPLKGNCWVRLPSGYHSPTERFFRSLKHKQLNFEKFRPKASAKLSIIDVWPFTTEKDLIQTQLSITVAI